MQHRRTQPAARHEARLPVRQSARRRPPNRDRLYLATTIAVIVLSLVAFAALIVDGADRIGGDGGSAGPIQAGAVDQTPPADAGAGVIPTPAPNPTATAISLSTPAPDAEDDTETTTSGDRPLVCLDVGHGGVDEGKLLLNEEETQILAREKDYTLAQALELRDRLEAQGIDVALTRETDTEVNATFEDVNGDGDFSEDLDGDGEIVPNWGDYVDELDELQARVNVCNEAEADLLLSIHINGAENTALHGYEAWYADGTEYTAASAEIAGLIVAELGEQFTAAGFETMNRGAAPDSALDLPEEDRNPNDFQHFVLLSPDVPGRNYVGARMPSVIVECLFISNEDDAAFLVGDEQVAQDAIVTAYENAIVAFFAEEGDEGGEGEEELAGFAVEGSPDASPPATPGGPPPDNGETAQVHYFGDSGRKEIALTFDLGSDRGYTEEILDFLKEEGIKASFGLTGRWAEENPDLVRRMVDEGHMLFNHTYTHRSFTGDSTGTEALSSAERIDEIERTHEIVLDLTGYDMRPYFRLTYGDGATDPQVMDDVYATDYYVVVMWSCDSNGWNQWTAAEIIQHCYGSAEPGGIILMHVGSDGTDQDALPGMVEAFAEDGYAFVTVEEILRS